MKSLLKYALVLLVALGSASAPAAFWQWSLTPATNSNVDPSINWTAGMSPSGIDPSGRAMMAAIARYRDDISGSGTTGGTATAYTFGTNQAAAGGVSICGVGTVPTDGQLLAVTVHATNGATATLAVDTCTAAPIQSAPGVAAPAGTLVLSSPYSLKYSVANTAWMLREFFGKPYGIPLGGLMPSTINSAPNSNFILPAGQCISTTTYAGYWALLGSPVPGACGAGTFAVIDMRGRVPIASDNLNGTFAGRLTTAAAGCGVVFNTIGNQCGNQSQTLTLAQLPGGISVANGAQAISVLGAVGHTLWNNGNLPIHRQLVGGSNSWTGGLAAGSAFAFSGSNTITATSNNTSGNAHPNVQPTIAVSYLLRVI